MSDPNCGAANTLPATVRVPATDATGAGERTKVQETPPTSPAVPAPPPTPPPGYELLEEIGRGGMGVVFRGRDVRLNRSVAIKFLREKYAANSVAARRFLDEARITGQLQHPGIPPVHEVGTLPDGRPFMVMKLIEGQTLADMLANDTSTRGSLLTAFEQVCQAVGYAHGRGVIHRDLKPQNIMVGAFGEIQVMDWGLAKFRADTRAESADAPTVSAFHDPRTEGDEDWRTRTGSFLGSPAFMSPEQAIGAVDQITERSDVFGHGGILCAILTGQPPFVGETAESTRQLAAQGQLTGAFSRLDACAAEPELVALCKRCLSAQPTDRPANAGEVAKAVAALRSAAEERARRAELDRVRAVGERAKAEAETREQRTRRRAQLAALTALGLLLVGGGALLLWRAEDKAERARVDGARMTEDARRAEQETARLTRNTDALAAHVNRCEDALRKDDAVTAAAALTEIDRRLREGGGEALADRVARCRADLALLRGLDSVDQFRWTPVENHLPRGDALAEKWRATFAAAGLDVKAVPPAELAGRVANSLLRDQLVAQLDMWLVESPSNEVREVLRRLDADSYRDAVRDAILMKDAKRIAELSGRAEALAQRPGFTAALGWQGAVPFTRRREILEVALGAHPGNLTLLLTAGTLSFPNVVATEVQWLRAAVAVAPKNPIAYLLVGLALLESGDLKGAEIALRSAHGLNPVYPHIRTALGALFLSKGYKHLDKHEFDLAITEFREAVRVDPTNYRPHIALALTHHEKGDLDAAITEYKATIQCAPKFALAHSCLGLALRMNGDLDGAVVAYNKAIEIDPKYAPARDGLAWLFATGPDRVRDGKQAVEHATRACELTAWKQPGYIDTLGAAHAETGDFDKASEYQKKALSFPNHEKNVGGLARQRLTLYARQKAYRDPGLQPRELAPPPHGVKR